MTRLPRITRPRKTDAAGSSARRTGGLVLAAIVGGGLVGVATHLTLPAPDPTPHIPQTSTPPPPSDRRVVAAPPVSFAGMTWRDYHGVTLPYSAAEGPRDTSGDLAARFARTPSGALLAAVHVAVRANAQWGPKVFEPTITKQVIGPDASTLLAATQQLYDKRRGKLRDGVALGRAYVVLEGFRWQGYSADTASLDVVSAGPGDSDMTVRAVTRIQLQWQNNDWRVIAPPGGTWGGAAASITSADGYVRFPNGGAGS
ncbi:hypothetical protein [Actinomadura opuntiae]|uniref:hypothetical protein n=1 Tax=Actinomadura sp. OS1-43 TaxID=604315 RepID=UPI00255A720D|nr:hypothetical protein [Actinomadura sp. OS1-43]MDL4813055.1 hypothetical protein [Actinomadura sp. OS1-43]